MKIFSSKKRVAVIGAITAVTLVGGGTAFAYWTASGGGTGQGHGRQRHHGRSLSASMASERRQRPHTNREGQQR